MKRNQGFVLGMLVIMLVSGLVLGGCATISSIGGTADRHGLIISKAKVVAEDAEEIASYTVILGLVDSGYEEYAATVEEAEAAGQKVTSVTTWYVVMSKIRAYAK